LKVSDIMPAALARKRPLVVISDKRYHRNGKLTTDKRIILNVEDLAADIAAAHPDVDVVIAKFRDMPWVEQLQVMSVAQVYITTAGSSSHMAVFMPRGGQVILLGCPEPENDQDVAWGKYTAFTELDRWFPLTYVQFQRYTTDIKDNSSYAIQPLQGRWEPEDPVLRARWRLYNANLHVDFRRLQPMLDQALGFSYGVEYR
jgi:hypothetical protein